MRTRLAGVLAILALACPAAAPADEGAAALRTVAEKTDFRATAGSAEVVRFIDDVSAHAGHISRFDFGKTFEGRPMVGAIVARPHVTTPPELRDDARLTVLVIGNIHSGECCGKEAVLRLLRELSLRPEHPWLDKLALLMVPNYNADGNDRMAKDNRPGQIGPVDGMGTRANAQGFDLNRDYMKLDSPEARALVALMSKWNPHCFIDLHTTNGSWHRYQLTYDVQHNPAADPALTELMRRRMMPAVTGRLQSRGIDTFYYGNFNRDHTRWSTADHKPRFGLDYVALRGRLSILSEAYSYITFRERIEVTHGFLSECLNFLAENALDVGRTLRQASSRTIRKGKTPSAADAVPIRSAMAPFPGKYTVKGFDPPTRPRVKLDEIVQGVRPKPPGVPKDYSVDFYGNFEPTKTVRRPWAYLIPPRLESIAARLRLHGIRVERLEAKTTLEVEVYRCDRIQRAARTFQKHNLVTVDATPRSERRELSAGTHVVRTGQPLGTLLVYLLEPESDDGLVAWNFFDDHLRVGMDFPVVRVVRSTPLRAR